MWRGCRHSSRREADTSATKNIKGITVEIAGDTTKLGKALKGVDEQSKDLTASLKYVDKLLDFDPGNTELLEEKQKLLADAIGNTTDRLETLRSVQDQVKRQYQSGDIGQRAYLDFRQELRRTEMQLDDLRDTSRNVKNALEGTGDEARETEPDLRSLGDGANDAADDFDDLAGTLKTLVKGGAIAGVTAVIGKAASAVGDIVEQTEEYREEMAKLDVSFEDSKLTAEDAEIAYRNLYRVLGETDQSVEASQQIALLADSTQDVVRWSRQAPGLVAKFGDALQPETFYESANETLKLGEATGAFVQLLEGTGVISVADFNKQLQALNDEESRQQYMLGVTEMLLGDAAAAYEVRNADVLAARDADREWQESLALIGETLAPVATAAKNFGADILNEFAPHVQTGVTALSDMWTQFGTLCDTMKEDWGEVETWFSDHWSIFTDGLKGVTEAIDASFTDTVDATDLAEQQLGQNAAAMTTIVDELSEDMSLAAYGVYDPWIGAGATVADVCDGMAQSYDEAVTYISKQKWRIPKPEVPKISVKGEFSLNPPKAPKFEVAWNARGGIFAGPMVLPAMDGSLQGFGEAGQEAVLPLTSFYENLERILLRNSAGGPVIHVDAPQFTVYAQTDRDLDTLSAQMADKFTDELERRLAGFG